MTSSATQVLNSADANTLTLWPSIDKTHFHTHITETHTFFFFTTTDSQKHKRKWFTCTQHMLTFRCWFYCFVWPLEFEFMSAVSMHRHAALLIRTVHVMSALSFSPSVFEKTVGHNHSLHHSLLLYVCENVCNCLHTNFTVLHTSFDSFMKSFDILCTGELKITELYTHTQ